MVDVARHVRPDWNREWRTGTGQDSMELLFSENVNLILSEREQASKQAKKHLRFPTIPPSTLLSLSRSHKLLSTLLFAPCYLFVVRFFAYVYHSCFHPVVFFVGGRGRSRRRRKRRKGGEKKQNMLFSVCRVFFFLLLASFPSHDHLFFSFSCHLPCFLCFFFTK